MADNVEGKGTYIEGIEHDDGTFITTEKGFTFQQEDGRELAFDIHEIDGAGTALLFGDQIFFLKYWTDEQLGRASEVFAKAVEMEKEKRK